MLEKKNLKNNGFVPISPDFFLFLLSFKCLLGAAGIPWEQQQNPILSTASHGPRASQEAKTPEFFQEAKFFQLFSRKQKLQRLNVRAVKIPGKSLAWLRLRGTRSGLAPHVRTSGGCRAQLRRRGRVSTAWRRRGKNKHNLNI